MKKTRLCLLFCVALLATGCPKYKPKVDFNDSNNLARQINTHFKAKQDEYFAALGGDDDATARRRRNELIEDALAFIDVAYEDFITDITAGRDRTNFVADVVELGTSAAIGITNGERAIQVLGVALTAFRGGRRSADLNFYREQTTPILINKMDGNRARVRAIILDGEGKDIDAYPIGRAIKDIVEYYNAGTLVRAFTELQKDTAAQTQRTERELDELKKRAGIVRAPTADELANSNRIATAMDAIVDVYGETLDALEAADEAVTAATQEGEAATKKVAAANQAIADAQARIDAPGAAAAAVATAQQDKLKAEADKATAELEKTAAEARKTKAEADRKTAAAARDAALNKLKTTHAAIEGDAALRPLLDKIPDVDPRYTPQFKATLQQALQRLKENRPVTTDAEREQRADDYALILRQVGKVVRLNATKDPTLLDRLLTILQTAQ